MIVTTSLGMDEGLVYRARRIASELGIEYKERKKAVGWKNVRYLRGCLGSL